MSIVHLRLLTDMCPWRYIPYGYTRHGHTPVSARMDNQTLACPLLHFGCPLIKESFAIIHRLRRMIYMTSAKTKYISLSQRKAEAQQALLYNVALSYFLRCLCVSYMSIADATAAFRDSNCPYIGMRRYSSA